MKRTRQEITIDGIVGGWTVVADVYPCGLAIHGASECIWIITHVASGRAVTWTSTRREAIAAVHALADVCDWHQGADDVLQHADEVRRLLERPETYGGSAA
jgi:hypothetical protein